MVYVLKLKNNNFLI